MSLQFNNLAILDSTFIPSPSSFSLLSLSSCFVPTPKLCDHAIILSQVEDFVRKLQWMSALQLSSRPPRFGYLPSTRWPSHALVPTSILRVSSKILQGCRSLLRASCSLSDHNLTPANRQELTRLQRCDSIITTADKGGKWTIIPTSAYRQEALRQLSDSSFYQPLDSDPSSVTRSKVTQILKYLRCRKFISNRELKFLLPPRNCQDRPFRLLPKLHKRSWRRADMPPGRPIISDKHSATRNVGNLVEFFLQPICEKLPSHLKDSHHLIALLRTTSLPPGSILFTFDVASLYTNVPINEGLDCVSRAFVRHPDTSRPDATLLHLLRLLLTSNTFSFDRQRWLQIHGVAMGKCFAGSFANIFLGEWEHRALSSPDPQPAMWVRFQDDIFGIWNHGPQSLSDFHLRLNTLHPNISLTLNSGQHVDFLDLSIAIVQDRLEYSVYAKDTDTHFILPKNSHHPAHTFKGILFGEFLRFASHSSTREQFNATVATVTPVWRSLGYSRSMIRRCKLEILSRTSQLSQWQTGMFPCNNPGCTVCPLAAFSTTVHRPSSNVVFPITSRITCATRNSIYLIRCKNCGVSYVGQTSRALKSRIEQHLNNITLRRQTPLYRHFLSTCDPTAFSFLGLDSHPKEETRKRKENLWIGRLNTLQPNGLNVAFNRATKANLVLPFSKCSSRLVAAIKDWCGSGIDFRASYTRDQNLRELLSRRPSNA